MTSDKQITLFESHSVWHAHIVREPHVQFCGMNKCLRTNSLERVTLDGPGMLNTWRRLTCGGVEMAE